MFCVTFYLACISMVALNSLPDLALTSTLTGQEKTEFIRCRWDSDGAGMDAYVFCVCTVCICLTFLVFQQVQTHFYSDNLSTAHNFGPPCNR